MATYSSRLTKNNNIQISTNKLKYLSNINIEEFYDNHAKINT